ncbi:MAG: hypothetical protein MUP03_10330 [Anaerolineales bacterium]|nr:hypothetical protein [Anaerolineales bacterium]
MRPKDLLQSPRLILPTSVTLSDLYLRSWQVSAAQRTRLPLRVKGLLP